MFSLSFPRLRGKAGMAAALLAIFGKGPMAPAMARVHTGHDRPTDFASSLDVYDHAQTPPLELPVYN